MGNTVEKMLYDKCIACREQPQCDTLVVIGEQFHQPCTEIWSEPNNYYYYYYYYYLSPSKYTVFLGYIRPQPFCGSYISHMACTFHDKRIALLH